MGIVNAGTITQRVQDERNALAATGSTNTLAPVGQMNVGTVSAPAAQPVQVAAASIDGAQVYQGACMACHAAGIAGAPRTGDKAAWAERIAQGADTLYTHAIGGFQGKAGVMHRDPQALLPPHTPAPTRISPEQISSAFFLA
ncbi:MAG: cytochrome c5 family protein [Gammaproteobacteria bacterium]|nr:cytochrome c5 family protein [Gammaproteobacteria bacterium]